ncbi:hypothetical protein TNCV_5049311 [Trichonephila clavipes]|nr:hypothetical protein TNCV_5049311 [Trichonephila clavipes]
MDKATYLSKPKRYLLGRNVAIVTAIKMLGSAKVSSRKASGRYPVIMEEQVSWKEGLLYKRRISSTCHRADLIYSLQPTSRNHITAFQILSNPTFVHSAFCGRGSLVVKIPVRGPLPIALMQLYRAKIITCTAHHRKGCAEKWIDLRTLTTVTVTNVRQRKDEFDVSHLASKSNSSQCGMIWHDFPEVINSIVVVKIPNPTDISLIWGHSKTNALTSAHFFKRFLMADVDIGPLSSSSCSEGDTCRCVSWCSSF